MVSKTYAEYIPSAKGKEHCAICTMFRTPDRCTYVDGEIKPEGWCAFYEGKKK